VFLSKTYIYHLKKNVNDIIFITERVELLRRVNLRKMRVPRRKCRYPWRSYWPRRKQRRKL
jgi:hypothetical protein